MTPEQIIQLVLWIPFGLIVLISGLIFCISGYKKGLWRALMALGATLLSALLSLLLARLLGSVLAAAALESIPADVMADFGLPEALMADLVSGAIKMAISLVLFSIFMFILTIILRSVCDLIAKGKLQPKNTLMKLLGMVVGGVCAVCYTLLLLLPLYGTLGAYLPVVETIVALSSDEDDSASAYLQLITSHPVVSVSGAGPVGAVYSGLAAMNVGDATLNVAQMARTADEMMNVLSDMSGAAPEELPERAKEMIRILREDVVGQRWFYDLAQESIATFRSQAAAEADTSSEEYVLTERFLDILSCPREDFTANCIAILDFADYCLEKDIVGILEAEDINQFYDSGIIAQAGALANCSPEAVEVKKLLLSTFMVSSQDMGLEEAIAYVEALGIGQVTDPANQLKEAEAILLLMIMEGELSAEVVMRYPGMGEKVLQERISSMGFAEAMGIEDPEVAATVNSDPVLQSILMTKLKQSASAPLGTETFSVYIWQLQCGGVTPE